MNQVSNISLKGYTAQESDNILSNLFFFTLIHSSMIVTYSKILFNVPVERKLGLYMAAKSS